MLGIPTFPFTIPDPNFSTRFNQSDDKESHLRHLIGCNLISSGRLDMLWNNYLSRVLYIYNNDIL